MRYWNILWIYIENQMGDKFHFSSYYIGKIRWELIYDDGNLKKEIIAYRNDSLRLQMGFEEMYNWLIENKLMKELSEDKYEEIIKDCTEKIQE